MGLNAEKNLRWYQIILEEVSEELMCSEAHINIMTCDMGCPSVYVLLYWLMNKDVLANGLAE